MEINKLQNFVVKLGELVLSILLKLRGTNKYILISSILVIVLSSFLVLFPISTSKSSLSIKNIIINILIGSNNKATNSKQTAYKKPDSSVKGATTVNMHKYSTDNFIKEDDGFFCPLTRTNQRLHLWTNIKYPANTSSVSIKTRLKSKLQNGIPTLYVAFGEYYRDKKSPYINHEWSIFENNYRSLRLNRNNDTSIEEYNPNLRILVENGEVEFTIYAETLNKNNRKIIFHPYVRYPAVGYEEIVSFEARKEFYVLTDAVNLNTKEFQIGIGTSNGNCLTLPDIEVKN